MSRVISDTGVFYDKKDLFVENTNVSGTYTIDWSNDAWNLVLTGDTTFIESDMPRSHRYSKIINIRVTGDYTLTLPPKWLEYLNGSYDGTANNLITVILVNQDVVKATIKTHPLISIEIESVRATSLGEVVDSFKGLYVSPDGVNVYTCNYGGGDQIYWWKMSTPHDLGSLSFVSKVYSGETVGPWGLTFKPDGTKIYFSEVAGTDSVEERPLTTAWDITTFGTLVKKSTSTDYYYPDNMSISTDGTKLLRTGEANQVEEFTMSTPWDISTLSAVNEQQILGYGGWVLFIDEGNYIITGDDGTTVKLRKLGTQNSVFTNGDVIAESSALTSGDGEFACVMQDLSYLYVYRASKQIAQYKLTITGI